MHFQPRMLFTLFAMGVFSYVVFAARNWPLGARLLPLAIGIPLVVLSLVQLGVEFYRSSRTTDQGKESFTADLHVDWEVDTAVVVRKASSYFGWLVGLGCDVASRCIGENVRRRRERQKTCPCVPKHYTSDTAKEPAL